jgi:hypothetical protein
MSTRRRGDWSAILDDESADVLTAYDWHGM